MRFIYLILFFLLINTTQSAEIRMLILKHSRIEIAQNDGQQVEGCVRDAAKAGLKIKVIENKFIDNLYDLDQSIENNIKKDAKKKDTLMIFTVGHGMQDGMLQNLGQRKSVMNVIAKKAEKYNQKIIWWQLSCYACAYLPSTSTLNEKQQNLLTIVASSPANQPSQTGVQSNIMFHVFISMARKNKNLDQDESGSVSKEELVDYLNRYFQMGSRVFSKPKNIIFEKDRIILKIIDKNNEQKSYKDDYFIYPN